MSALNMATFSEVKKSGKSWSKWEIALIVGAPVALGLGYLLYKSQYNTEVSKPAQDAKSKAKATPPATESNELEHTLQDPLEKAQAAKNRGNKLFLSGKYEDAIECYNAAIRLCPSEMKMDLSKFYQNRAAAHEGLKNYVAVKADCTKALELNSKYTKALFRRAKACEITKDLRQCLEDVTAVCILEGFQNQSSLLMADRILKEQGKQHAKEAIKNRQPMMPSKHFIKTYFGSFAEDPITSTITENHIEENTTRSREESEEETGYEAARIYFQQEEYDKVIDACTLEINQPTYSSHRGEALLLRGSFYLLRGEMQKALQDLSDAIATPDASIKVQVNALIKRASTHLQQERIQESLQDYEKAINLDPDNSDVYHHRGQMYLLTDQISEAMSDFEKSVKLNDNFPTAYIQKCYTQYRHAVAEQNTAGIESLLTAFEQAIKRFPTCTECYSLYGQVLIDRQEYDKAEELFKKALEVDTDNATVYVHRGLLKLQSNGDVNEAIKLINKAVEIDDKCEFGYETLGTIEVQRGNMKRAIELFDKAIPLAKTELEMAHLYSLKDAASAQARVAETLGIQIPTFAMQ